MESVTARTKKILKSEIRITDHISLGVLTRFVPKNIINDILQSTHTESKRERLLPAHVVVYYVLSLSLLMSVEACDVLRWLLEGLRWLGWKPVKDLL